MHPFSRLLAAGSIVLGSAAGFGPMATPAAAAPQPAQQTCRPALGESFSQSSGNSDRLCCMVLQQQRWYEQKGVVNGRIYLRADMEKIEPRICTRDELNAIRAANQANADEPEDEAPPQGKSDKRKKRHVYY